MSHASLYRGIAPAARCSRAFHRHRFQRSISLNSGIEQGLRAEKWDKRSVRRERRGSTRSDERPSYDDLPERGPRFRGDIPRDFANAVAKSSRQDSRRTSENSSRTSRFGDALTRPHSSSRTADIDPKYRSGKKPGKWERAALAAGGNRDDWRDVRAAQRPGTGPTKRYSAPDEVWNRFGKRGNGNDEHNTKLDQDLISESPKPLFRSEPVHQSDRHAQERSRRREDRSMRDYTAPKFREASNRTRDRLLKHDSPVQEEASPIRSSSDRNEKPQRLRLSSATSELLFGRNAVLSVLRSKRRKLYKLYIHERSLSESKGGDDFYFELGRLSSEAGVEVQHVDNEWLPLFDRTTQGKPHNGCILEASPVPTPLITSLQACATDNSGPYFTVNLDRSDASPAMRAKASIAKVRYTSEQTDANDTSRPQLNPLVIYCHNLTDTGNFGALLRSAYWFNVAGVAFPLRGSAKPDGTTVKTSSGASEGVNLFSVRDTTAFLKQTREAGWEIVAAMPPSSKTHFGNLRARSEYSVPDIQPRLAQLRQRSPVLLMLGGEEHGIPFSLAQIATGKVSIASGYGRTDELGVDSLNVSVAGSLILAEFARPLQAASTVFDSDVNKGTFVDSRLEQVDKSAVDEAVVLATAALSVETTSSNKEASNGDSAGGSDGGSDGVSTM